MLIYVLFKNSNFEITCTNVISSSFFIKQTIDVIDTLECIFLKSEIELSPGADDIIQNMLTYEFSKDCLNKIIDSETNTEMQVTFEFSEEGLEYMDYCLTNDIEIEILLLLDCLDIKAHLVALLTYLTKNRGRNYEELLATIRQRRYEMPMLYSKKK